MPRHLQRTSFARERSRAGWAGFEQLDGCAREPFRLQKSTSGTWPFGAAREERAPAARSSPISRERIGRTRTDSSTFGESQTLGSTLLKKGSVRRRKALLIEYVIAR
jgi:hypothetical protein